VTEFKTPTRDNPPLAVAPPKKYRGLPSGIWILGFVSMLMDTSSELIHSLLPIFMVSVLGVSMMTVGLIEGVAEATAAITKVFSGAISDYFGKRKLLAVIGYGLAAITKPIFPLANSVAWVFAARFIDRIGKGIRGAPRDALVADIAPRELRGAAYGLRQSLDSVGAFLGPALAVLLMILLAGNIHAVLWMAVIPAFLAVALLVFGVREPKHLVNERSGRNPLSIAEAKRLPFFYWMIVLLGAVFTLARFSEAFLILRAQDLGLSIAYVPVILIIMNVVYAVSAYPAGIAADKFSHEGLLVLGLALLIAADVLLAMATTPSLAFLGAALWGLHMGLTQGLFSKLVADSAPKDLLGTAFGIFGLATGCALLVASVVAGALWSTIGAPATFIAGAGFAALAMLGLIYAWLRSQKTRL
jgi:MFS family permease